MCLIQLVPTRFFKPRRSHQKRVAAGMFQDAMIVEYIKVRDRRTDNLPPSPGLGFQQADFLSLLGVFRLSIAGGGGGALGQSKRANLNVLCLLSSLFAFKSIKFKDRIPDFLPGTPRDVSGSFVPPPLFFFPISLSICGTMRYCSGDISLFPLFPVSLAVLAHFKTDVVLGEGGDNHGIFFFSRRKSTPQSRRSPTPNAQSYRPGTADSREPQSRPSTRDSRGDRSPPSTRESRRPRSRSRSKSRSRSRSPSRSRSRSPDSRTENSRPNTGDSRPADSRSRSRDSREAPRDRSPASSRGRSVDSRDESKAYSPDRDHSGAHTPLAPALEAGQPELEKQVDAVQQAAEQLASMQAPAASNAGVCHCGAVLLLHYGTALAFQGGDSCGSCTEMRRCWLCVRTVSFVWSFLPQAQCMSRCCGASEKFIFRGEDRSTPPCKSTAKHAPDTHPALQFDPPPNTTDCHTSRWSRVDLLVLKVFSACRPIAVSRHA